jgi:iron donor protein CyaY
MSSARLSFRNRTLSTPFASLVVLPMLDERQFRMHCDQALESLQKRLAEASDRFGFESDMNNGAITVEFEDPPARFVVSPNTPVRQIWVSALSKSFKLVWDEGRGEFALPETGQSLQDLLASKISDLLGEQVEL